MQLCRAWTDRLWGRERGAKDSTLTSLYACFCAFLHSSDSQCHMMHGDCWNLLPAVWVWYFPKADCSWEMDDPCSHISTYNTNNISWAGTRWGFFPLFFTHIWERHCLLLTNLSYGLRTNFIEHVAFCGLSHLVFMLLVFPLIGLPDMIMPANTINESSSTHSSISSGTFIGFTFTSCYVIYFVGSWNSSCCEAHVLFLWGLCSLSVICPQQMWERARRHVMQISYRGHELNMLHRLLR